MPVTTEAHGGTKPDAAVAETKPAMVPEQRLTTDHFRVIG